MDLKSAIFLMLIALFIASLFLFPLMRWIILLFLGLALVYVFYKFFVNKYSECERGVILRMGRFNRIAGPGWSIVVPFFEREMAKIDIRTHQMSVFIPEAFTEKEIKLKVNGFAYYKVVDPKRAILEIEDYRKALRNLLSSTLRNLFSSMSITEVFANLDDTNRYARKMARRKWQKWGIDVPSIELVKITPSEEIISAMQKQKIAKEEYQAKRIRAEARRITIEALGEGAKKLDDRAITYLYIKALEELGKGKATKMIFPMSFLNSLNKVGDEISKEGAMGLGAVGGLSLSEAIDKVKNTIEQKSQSKD